MSTSNDATQIVIVLQPQGESETSELLTRLGQMVDLDPAKQNTEMSAILADGELKRVMWATCEVADLRRFGAYEAIATTLEKMMSLRPGSRGRLKAMIMIDDPEAEVEATLAADAAPLN